VADINELGLCADFLFEQLTGHAPLTALVGDRVYRDLAPPGAVLPYVIFGFVVGVDRNAMGSRSIMFTRPIYDIKGVVQGTDSAAADAIADAVHGAVNGKQRLDVAVGELVVLGVRRESLIEFIELRDDMTYIHRGGTYRTFAHILRS
jgi:uncharacterized protein DUF3168